MRVVMDVNLSDIENLSWNAIERIETLENVFTETQIEDFIEDELGDEPRVERIDELMQGGTIKDIAERIARYLGRDLGVTDLARLGVTEVVGEDGSVIHVFKEDERQMKLFPEMENGLPPMVYTVKEGSVE